MNIDYIINKFDKLEDVKLFREVYSFVNSKLDVLNPNDKEVVFNHIFETIITLLNFNADCLTIVSYLLSQIINYNVSIEEIEEKFGDDISNIALKVNKIINYEKNNERDNYKNSLISLENGKEMDFRVLFIILGDKINKMGTINNLYDKDKKMIAYNTLYVLVPVADRLGFQNIKSKLEDLCLYYLKPYEYKDILIKLNATPEMLNILLNQMKNNISSLLEQYNIKYEIKCRVKNIYSIYNKLSSGRNFNDIYDILAIRIIVDNEYECNLIANLIHSKYKYIPSRFKDYITVPKENMYQSLHTTIIGEDNRYYEIQIRTHKMHKIAEIGDASHHKYKQRKLKKIDI